jgi:methionyl-tRNA synthetase
MPCGVLAIYLKPVLPEFAKKTEQFLAIEPLSFADTDKTLENHKINDYIRLVERVEQEKV